MNDSAGTRKTQGILALMPLRRFLLSTAGVLLLLCVWSFCARTASGLVLPGPIDTARALWQLGFLADAWRAFGITLVRVAAAIAVGGAIGLVLGIAAGLWRDLRWLLEPLRWISMSVPPVTVIVLAMLWLGMGTSLVVTFAAVMLAPIVYVNTVKGVDLVDLRLVEMAHIYRFPLWMRIRRLYIPALAAPLGAAAVQVVCNAVRVTLLAEVMGANSGMGAAISRAGTMLELPTLYAWVVLSVIVVGILEMLLLTPIQRKVARWSRPA